MLRCERAKYFARKTLNVSQFSLNKVILGFRAKKIALHFLLLVTNDADTQEKPQNALQFNNLATSKGTKVNYKSNMKRIVLCFQSRKTTEHLVDGSSTELKLPLKKVDIEALFASLQVNLNWPRIEQMHFQNWWWWKRKRYIRSWQKQQQQQQWLTTMRLNKSDHCKLQLFASTQSVRKSVPVTKSLFFLSQSKIDENIDSFLKAVVARKSMVSRWFKKATMLFHGLVTLKSTKKSLIIVFMLFVDSNQRKRKTSKSSLTGMLAWRCRCLIGNLIWRSETLGNNGATHFDWEDVWLLTNWWNVE